jgi:microcystin degradation protein MlrC
MHRVLFAGLFHETHTFLEGRTGPDDFAVKRGGELLAAVGDSSPMGGALERARAFGWTVLPAADYRAQPGPLVTAGVVESFWRDLQAAAASDAGRECDAAFLVLHGAMVSEGNRDVEGWLLRKLRELPGWRDKPVFGVFDLHAGFSQDMAAASDCLVAYRENPHTDAREAAVIAADLLQRCLEEGVTPAQRHRALPLVWPPTGTATANDPMRTLEAEARKLETHPGVWSVSVVAGFSFADTEHTGVSLVASGTDAEALEAALDHLTSIAWELREQGNVTDPPLHEVMELLKTPFPGLTVLVEPSDNIGGGAPGDGTGLLRALVEHEIENAAICIADAESVKTAMAVGAGGRTVLSIGGKGSRLDAGPLSLEGEIVSLRDGRFELEDKNSHLASMSGDFFDMGPCALVRHGGLLILLTSVKTPPFDLGQWRSQGVEPCELSVIVAKAAVAHRRAYDPVAARMLWVDTPGPCSSNLSRLPYRHLRRPVYPLDPGVKPPR